MVFYLNQLLYCTEITYQAPTYPMTSSLPFIDTHTTQTVNTSKAGLSLDPQCLVSTKYPMFIKLKNE